MSRILVTGASGFIGRQLTPHLQGAGHEVVAVTGSDGNVSERATWDALPATDVVVHLAARSFVPASWDDPAAFVEVNVLGTVHALEYCRQHGAALVFLSSYMYGAPERLPIREDAPLAAQNPYALSKKLAEEACRFYAERFGIPVTVLRPFNVYGPGQALPFLIPFIIGQVETGGGIRVKDLEPRRDYVYVGDLVEAITAAVAQPRGFRVLNVGSGESVSVADLIAIIQETWGTSLPVSSEGVRRKDEIMDTIADVTAAACELGWRPRVSLRDGLAAIRQSSA